MNEERSLSRLYQRLAGARPAAPEAQLGRLLRELEADSEALAADVARLHRPAHLPRGREVRVATHRRVAAPLRWISGMAACLALALGVLAIHGQQAVRWRNVAADAHSVAVVDRGDQIFASGVDGVVPAASDEIFRGTFSARGS